MARPLPEKRLEKMDLTVKTFDGESKKLGKQVGFNKYVVDKETHEIVMLVEKLEKKGDALLILEDHGKDKPVIKIVENLFHTADKPYGYVLDADGKVKFEPTGDMPIRDFPTKDNKVLGALEIYSMPQKFKRKNIRIWTGSISVWYTGRMGFKNRGGNK